MLAIILLHDFDKRMTPGGSLVDILALFPASPLKITGFDT